MRITPSGPHTCPFYLKPFFWNQKRKYGRILKPALLWARVPRLFAAIALLYGVLDRKRSPLDPVLRSLVTVRVSQINGCRFCVDINSATLARRAGSMDKVMALEGWREDSVFNEEERAVLDYTEAVTDTALSVTDEMIRRLGVFYDEDAIVELTGLIAFQNLSSKFNTALDVPAEGFCKIPETPTDGYSGSLDD